MLTFYDFIRNFIVTPPLAIVGGLSVVGQENLQQEGGIILAALHDSWFDSLWLARAVSPRRVNFMAKKELFTNPVVSWYLKNILAFPVDRKKLSREVIRYTVDLLAQGV